MKLKKYLTEEEIEACVADISRAAGDLSRITALVQEVYGRDSVIGEEGQKAAEAAALFGRELKGLQAEFR